MSTMNMKRAISLLREMANLGTMEQGQRKAILKAICGLQQARRSHNREKFLKAVNSVCEIFVRMHDR